MNCRETRALLEELADGSLPVGERAAADRHLALCPDCRAALGIVRATSTWLRVAREEPPVPSPGFSARLRARLAEHRPEPTWLWFAVEAYARPLAYVLAAVMLGLGISLATMEVPARPAQVALAGFDSPPAVAGQVVAPTTPMDRDQVLLTLVSQPEVK